MSVLIKKQQMHIENKSKYKANFKLFSFKPLLKKPANVTIITTNKPEMVEFKITLKSIIIPRFRGYYTKFYKKSKGGKLNGSIIKRTTKNKRTARKVNK